MGTSTAVITTGNITTINSGLLQNGNSNVALTANGNVVFGISGNSAIVTISGTGANITGTANISGNTSVGNLDTAGSISATGNITMGYAKLTNGITSNRSNVSVTTDTVIDQFVPGVFRTAKYTISASSINGYQSVETLLVHDGVNAYITIYGSLCSNVSADILDISANINGATGNVTLYATSPATATVQMIAQYLLT